MASVVVVGLATVKVLPCKSRTTVFQNRCDDCVRPQPTYLTIGRCTVPPVSLVVVDLCLSSNERYSGTRVHGKRKCDFIQIKVSTNYDLERARCISNRSVNRREDAAQIWSIDGECLCTYGKFKGAKIHRMYLKYAKYSTRRKIWRGSALASLNCIYENTNLYKFA